LAPIIGLALLLTSLQDIPAPRANTSVAADLRGEMAELLRAEAAELEEHAARLAAAGRGTEAHAVRTGIESPPPTDGPLRFVTMEEYVSAEELARRDPAGAEAAAIRSETARQLLALARKAAAPGTDLEGIAVECLRAAVRRDPGNREVRRLLGYVEHDGGWATPHAAQDLRAGKVLDPTFGWVPADWVPHLKQGELPGLIRPGQPLRWLPAERADALRREFSRGWEITTEHFVLKTNVPLAEAIAFGRRLEAVREVFFMLLPDLIDPADRPMARRFRDPNLWAEPSTARHEVWYFATKAGYVNFFKRLGRDQSKSLGYYMTADEAGRNGPGSPRAYFFREPEPKLDALATLFHEASHQLLFESAGPSGYARNRGHYWIWEGLGTYFESLVPRPDGSYEIGGRDGPRMSKARADLVDGPGIMPVADLIGMGEYRYKTEWDIHSVYAESMALAVFLMHGEGGRHRQAFLDYARDAYRGRIDTTGPEPLFHRLGESAETIDERFHRFLAGRPEEGPR
jgi:hypothetical protein